MACVEVQNGCYCPRISFAVYLSHSDKGLPEKPITEDLGETDYDTNCESCRTNNVKEARDAADFGKIPSSSDDLFVEGTKLPQNHSIIVCGHLESSRCASPVRSASRITNRGGLKNAPPKTAQNSSGRWKKILKPKVLKEAEEETKGNKGVGGDRFKLQDHRFGHFQETVVPPEDQGGNVYFSLCCLLEAILEEKERPSGASLSVAEAKKVMIPPLRKAGLSTMVRRSARQLVSVAELNTGLMSSQTSNPQRRPRNCTNAKATVNLGFENWSAAAQKPWIPPPCEANGGGLNEVQFQIRATDKREAGAEGGHWRLHWSRLIWFPYKKGNNRYHFY